MNIVADTNMLISSIFWNGPPYKIVQRALDNKLEIFTSTTILNEVRKVLRDPKEKFTLSEQETDDVIDAILSFAKVVQPKIIKQLSRDKKDDPIIACAIFAKANYMITRDKDLLVLKDQIGINILTPEEFIKNITKTY